MAGLVNDRSMPMIFIIKICVCHNYILAIAFNSLPLQGGEISGNLIVDGTLNSTGNLSIQGGVIANSLIIDAGTF